MIIQGEFGAFVCSIAEFGKMWNFGYESLEFIGTHGVGEFIPSTPLPNANTFARLLMRNITDSTTNLGIRTSVLYFEPAPDFTGSINISCQGILPTSPLCIKTVVVTGEYLLL